MHVPPPQHPCHEWDSERWATLGLVPALTTGLFYLLPGALQQRLVVQFLPQLLAYLAFMIWIARNRTVAQRLGVLPRQLGVGVKWGALVGAMLGLVNAGVILWLVPSLSEDIRFLTQTPHARVPPALMVPWTILLIAVLVELNFRGFQLGRWLRLCRRIGPAGARALGPVAAVGASSLVFAFDPFMVATFKHLHWIALWDGAIWGWLWLRLNNLYATIVAHAVEVMILYLILRTALAE